MLSPFLIRTITAVILIICATVVLGISAHVENSVRQFEVKTATFTYDAFVGAFTVLVEIIFVILRILSPNSIIISLGAESALGGLLWALWLVAAVVTTHYTSDDRSACKHLNDIFSLPEFDGLDPEAVKLAKKIFKSACSEIHAELAFLWIGFILTTAIVGTSVFLWMKMGRNKEALREKVFVHHKPYGASAKDPFADPEGAAPSRSVGIVDPNEPIERV